MQGYCKAELKRRKHDRLISMSSITLIKAHETTAARTLVPCKWGILDDRFMHQRCLPRSEKGRRRCCEEWAQDSEQALMRVCLACARRSCRPVKKFCVRYIAAGSCENDLPTCRLRRALATVCRHRVHNLKMPHPSRESHSLLQIVRLRTLPDNILA